MLRVKSERGSLNSPSTPPLSPSRRFSPSLVARSPPSSRFFLSSFFPSRLRNGFEVYVHHPPADGSTEIPRERDDDGPEHFYRREGNCRELTVSVASDGEAASLASVEGLNISCDVGRRSSVFGSSFKRFLRGNGGRLLVLNV